jgi:uncharacterized protein (TIGR02145 family)
VGDYYQFTCGTQQYLLAKAICNYSENNVPKAEAYDPATGVCITGNNGGVSSNCGGLGYNRQTQFCAKASAEAEVETIFARCGALYNGDGKLGTTADSLGLYDPIAEFCLDKAGGYFSPGSVSGSLATTNLDGEKKTRCEATWQQGRYTSNDFCNGTGTNAKVYRRCEVTASSGTGTSKLDFNPATQFCQPLATETGYTGITTTGTAAGTSGAISTAQTPGSAPSKGVIKPRCGTQYVGVSVNLAGFGTGSYAQDRFCSPLTTATTAGAGAKLYEKCKSQGIGTSNSNTSLTAKPTLPVGNPYDLGEYNATQFYCHLTLSGGTLTTDAIGANGKADASIQSLPECLGTTTKYDPAREFCGPSNKVYPICNGFGVEGLVKSTDGANTQNDYEVASEFCDVRGQVLPTIDATTLGSGHDATDPTDKGKTLQISLGKLYSYVNLGGKDWLATDLKLDASTNTIGLSGTPDLFTWLQATSTATPLCPEGWTLSSDADWTALAAAAGQYAGSALRARGASTGWDSPSEDLVFSAFGAKPGTGAGGTPGASDIRATNASDISKFVALTDGTISASGPAYGNTVFNVWWTSNELNTDVARVRYIKDSEVSLGSDTYNKLSSYFSIRCVR